MGRRLSDRVQDLFEVLNVNASAKTIYGRKCNIKPWPDVCIGTKRIAFAFTEDADISGTVSRMVEYTSSDMHGNTVTIRHPRIKRLADTSIGRRPDMAYALFVGWQPDGKSSTPALEILKTKHENLEMGVEVCPAPLTIDLLSGALKTYAKRLRIDCNSTRPLSLHVVSS